jgi:hypothetical protein
LCCHFFIIVLLGLFDYSPSFSTIGRVTSVSSITGHWLRPSGIVRADWVKDLFSLSSTTGRLRSGGVGFGGGELTPSRWKISAIVERFGASLRLPYSPK